MTEAQLRELLSEETLAWAERSPADIVAELASTQIYQRGRDDTWHKIEVTLLEATDDCIRVKTSIPDGSLVWALKPITSSSSSIATDVSSFECDRNGEISRARPLHAKAQITDILSRSATHIKPGSLDVRFCIAGSMGRRSALERETVEVIRHTCFSGLTTSEAAETSAVPGPAARSKA